MTETSIDMKVAVLGAAGGIGQPLSLLLQMDPNVDEIALFDVVSDWIFLANIDFIIWVHHQVH